jgi:putative flippase GtrA
MPKVWKYQPVRFLLVGLLNTAFSYSVYAVLLYVGLPYAAANFGALTCGILFSFRTQGGIVFNNSDRRLLLRFITCWFAIYLVNIAIIKLLLIAGMNAYIAGAAAMIPITAMSYFIQKYLVFRISNSAPKSGLQGQ